MELQLQQYPIQEALIPLLSEAQLLNLSNCNTTLRNICELWIKKITLPNKDKNDMLRDYDWKGGG
jgi:hypothetical protein